MLVDFWTYTCINCIRTLPFLKGLYAHYHRYGLQVVGVETPEFTFEQEASNVQQAITSDGLRYPVVQDNRYGTWNAYQNQYWPAEYLIDATGPGAPHPVRGGRLQGRTRRRCASCSTRPARTTCPPPMTATAMMPSAHLGTPETYLNPQRAQGFAQPLTGGTHFYPGVKPPSSTSSASTARGRPPRNRSRRSHAGASITGPLPGRPRLPGDDLQGQQAAHCPRACSTASRSRPPPAGSDVHNGVVTVPGQRLYSLISLPDDQQQTFTIQIPPGVSAYDFTFG